MGKRVFMVSGLLLCLVSYNVVCGAAVGLGTEEEVLHEAKLVRRTSITAISGVEKDITTPLTTVPASTNNFIPASTPPIYNPNSIPEQPATNLFPLPLASPSISSPSPVISGASWCVASQNAPRSALQVALDYACAHTDCSAIQPGGTCYYPDTLLHHASFAFNSYFQKNPIPTSCNFKGAALITSTNPSSGTCQYPSTSTSSSVLDTANQNVSTVFGVGPPGQPISAGPLVNNVPLFLSGSLSFLVFLLRYG